MARTTSRPLILPLLLALVALAGCRSSGPPPPMRAGLRLVGTAAMNGGNAVVVRVYALRSADALERATLEEVWAGDEAAMPGAIVQRTEHRLYPGDALPLDLELPDGTAFVGVVANLRESERYSWRQVLPVAVVRADPPPVVTIDATAVTSTAGR